MEKQNRKFLQNTKPSIWRVLGTLVSLALLVYLVLSQGWVSFLDVLQRIPVSYFLAALALGLISRFFVSLRWFILLRSAGIPIRYSMALRLVFMGLFASNFLPSTIGGDVVRLAGALYLRLDGVICAASLVVDRLIGMAGMALFLPFGLAAVTRSGTGLQSSLPVAIVTGSFFSVPGAKRLWQKFTKFIRDLLRSAMHWMRNPTSLGLAFLCTFGHQLCTYLIAWVFLRGMQLDLSLTVIAGLWSLSYFFSLAPISINGLGLQEVSIAYLYSRFGGIPMQAGVALALLMRMVFLLVSLPGVIFLPDILRPIPAAVVNQTAEIEK